MHKIFIAVLAVLVAMSASAEAKYNAVTNADSKPAAAKGSSAPARSGYAKSSGKTGYNKASAKVSSAKAVGHPTRGK